MEWWKKLPLLVLVIALCVVGFLVFSPTIFGDQNTIVEVKPSTTYVSANEQFDIYVNCTPVEQIKGWELQVSFDPNYVQVVDITEGDIFDDYDTFFATGDIDNANGSIEYILDLTIGADNMVTEPGSLCIITFESLSNDGTSTIDIHDVGVCNDTDYITIDVYDGDVTVDSLAPEITSFDITTSVPIDTYTGWENVSGVVNHYGDVVISELYVTYPDGTESTLDFTNLYHWYVFNQIGDYSMYFYVEDSVGNNDTSSIINFAYPPNYDIDKDRNININDIIDVSNHYDEIGSPGWIREDVDNDGSIIVIDLVYVSNHYLETW